MIISMTLSDGLDTISKTEYDSIVFFIAAFSVSFSS